jgi:hypothetical protein
MSNGSTSERRRVIPMTAQFGAPVEHQVSDDTFALGRGKYQALCGQVFIPVAMAAPPGRPCPECQRILSAARQAAASASRRGRHRRHGLLRRLVLACQSRRVSTGEDTTR